MTEKFLNIAKLIRTVCSRLGSHSENHLKKILNTGRFICAKSSRFGRPENNYDFFSKSLNLQARCPPASDPLRLSAPVLAPPGPGIIPCQGAMGTTTNAGTPPLSIASDTRRSSPRTPHQCRTLAGCHAHRMQSPVHSSARDVTQLHIKGVLRPVSSSETSDTPPCARQSV